MREYKSQRVQSKEEFETTQIQEWLADSHYWINEHQTFHCKWCGKLTTTVLQGDAFLCLKNPEIIKILTP